MILWRKKVLSHQSNQFWRIVPTRKNLLKNINHLILKQINHVIKGGSDRLNVIKTLSHPLWGLKQETFLNLFKSLVRSLIDYTSFAVTYICKTNMDRIQVVQNNALRCIFKKPRGFNIKKLHELSKMETVEVRMRCLNDRYFERALIELLIDEYDSEFKNVTTASINTILCEIAVVHMEWAWLDDISGWDSLKALG